MAYQPFHRRNSTVSVAASITVLALSFPLSGAQAQTTMIGSGTTVSVPGTHLSPWNIGEALAVNGTMNVVSGGVVRNTSGEIASAPGSTGAVTVAGAGSVWSNTSQLFVGQSGHGTLAVSDGGSVSSGWGYIGREVGSTGTVSIDGTGSSWDSSYGFYVGYSGNGTLAITDGGSVTSPVGYIGFYAGSTGEVTVTGAGSTWNNGGGLNIGRYGGGTLVISDGGTVSNTNGYIGRDAGSTGEVSVTGAGSSWNNSFTLHVGTSGDGTLAISDGAKVSSADGSIGRDTGSAGAVSITGAGSSWTNDATLHVGSSGTGTLAISDGGMVSSTDGLIGVRSGGRGVVSIAGADSSWSSSGDSVVGHEGSGRLDVSTSGSVSNTNGFVGYASGSSGEVSVAGGGSSWENSGSLYVGTSGDGRLAISDGGTVSSTDGLIGVRSGGAGAVSVAGAGSSWSSSGDFVVGYEGGGTLDISDGGMLSSTNGFVGYASGASGTVSVDGAASSWSSSTAVSVGHDGDGMLAISGNGLVSADHGVILARNSGSTGTLDLATGGILQTRTLAAGDGTAGATFDGGILRAIADNAGFVTGFAPGTLVLDADGLIIDDNGYVIGTDASAFSGSGGLDKIGSGTLILMGANDYSGATTVAAGHLQAGDSGVFSPNSAFEIMTGATLDLNGHDQSLAALVNSGSVETGSTGSLTPVGTTLAVSGNYESNGGSLTLRTILGNDSSPTDKLIADTVTTGAEGATTLFITNIGGLGAYTTGAGIEVVQVGTSSSSDAFVLGRPVTAGINEYLLEQSSNQSWYLTSRSSNLRNPNIGSTLGNQYAAATMFAHTILDRRESVRSADQTLWIRARHSALNTDLLGGLQHAGIRTSVVQIGADLVRYEDIVAGFFGGYGHSSIDNRSNQTGTTADGRVDGTSIGLYASWMPDENKGPYADVWGLYAWYDNELRGLAQNRTTKYDSSGYSLSAEAGYGFTLGTESDGRSWIFKPHVQLGYVSIDTDSFRDSHGTWYSDSQGSGVTSRLGARLQGQWAAGQSGLSPFVELNWLYSDVDNAVRLDGTRLSSTIGRNVGEIKAGLSGRLSESVSVWGHLGAQRGSEGFERYDIQLGLGWQW